MGSWDRCDGFAPHKWAPGCWEQYSDGEVLLGDQETIKSMPVWETGIDLMVLRLPSDLLVVGSNVLMKKCCLGTRKPSKSMPVLEAGLDLMVSRLPKWAPGCWEQYFEGRAVSKHIKNPCSRKHAQGLAEGWRRQSVQKRAWRKITASPTQGKKQLAQGGHFR